MTTVAQAIRSIEDRARGPKTRSVEATCSKQYTHNGWCWVWLKPGLYWAQAVIPASLQADMDTIGDKVLSLTVGDGIYVQSILFDGSKPK